MKFKPELYIGTKVDANPDLKSVPGCIFGDKTTILPLVMEFQRHLSSVRQSLEQLENFSTDYIC
jgi:hypothetical protein